MGCEGVGKFTQWRVGMLHDTLLRRMDPYGSITRCDCHLMTRKNLNDSFHMHVAVRLPAVSFLPTYASAQIYHLTLTSHRVASYHSADTSTAIF